jgi:hypothetical protein
MVELVALVALVAPQVLVLQLLLVTLAHQVTKEEGELLWWYLILLHLVNPI